MTTSTILVTGGAGFIGCSFARLAIKEGFRVIILDKLTYAGNLQNIADINDNVSCVFIKGDINDRLANLALMKKYAVISVINFAAESHVDNSIHSPEEFITTNINGVYNLLTASLEYYNSLSSSLQKKFKFIQISTDEVYGSLKLHDKPFNENSPYQPNSPYSASKASSDHLARSWLHTYSLPTIITNCSNNYGPYQHKEKLIPKIISNALSYKKIPIYGLGQNIRDWIYVEDHVRGVLMALQKGVAGEQYLFGGENELSNIELAKTICSILDEYKAPQGLSSYSELVEFVTDRPGHDFRYAIDNTKVHRELGFKCKVNFQEGIKKTIEWFIKNN